MPIKITLGAGASAAIENTVEAQATVRLKAHKSLSGNIIIQDHDLMDIVINPSNNKVMMIPHAGSGEEVYYKQKEFYTEMTRRGLFDGPMEAGAIYGVFEGNLGANEEVSPVQVALLELEKYFNKYHVEGEFGNEYEEDVEDRFINPEDAESTELGHVENEEDIREKQPARGGMTYGGYVY